MNFESGSQNNFACYLHHYNNLNSRKYGTNTGKVSRKERKTATSRGE